VRRALVALAALAFVGAANADTVVGVGGSHTFVGVGGSHTFVVVGGSDTFAVAPTPQATSVAPTAAAAPPSMQELQALWMGAGAAYGIPWQVLAAINKIESNFGGNMGPSSAGAIGWMQFMPGTWQRWGVDVDGDGIASPWSAADAIYSAARYLAAAGGATDLPRAIYAYNHAGWYVNEVLSLAALYASGGTGIVPALNGMQSALNDARTRLADVSSRLAPAVLAARALARSQSGTLARARNAALLSDGLELQKRAVQIEGRLAAADARVQALRNELAATREQLGTAVAQSNAATFDPAGAQLLSAPTYSGHYVFPVGGGPGLVSVGHTHHDFPAADIDAPMGAPVYALSDGVVVRAWGVPDGACGIGLTITTTDGQTWTYCHLSYLDPGVRAGTRLAAGSSVGLVGATGDATGPHLHLQLDPPTAYPQNEAWFAGFAGSAFRWQDAGVPRMLVSAVGSGGPESTVVSDPVVEFSQNVVHFTR
jgi:murein DD-endopeptidase MepM/ murein hydrolase activator NlpD